MFPHQKNSSIACSAITNQDSVKIKKKMVRCDYSSVENIIILFLSSWVSKNIRTFSNTTVRAFVLNVENRINKLELDIV